ncbi:MAG: acyl-CoA thioesterase [Pseudonocardia sp.]|jgi:acyl-CoA thioesterase-2|uniref:acyl-CoA thioesterase n=1 Tax=Pseudonocardia sp. TaxID=60912 RepID=UPI0026332E88|nr:acyl-CoA thioesterase domain-containing protein [Pseudonocardia sp.]MCU1630718.1 acyl-CoA thioesterase [Pseudonocardia sp.]MDT7699906.1 acyl-CoA thioesterase [Pseudonocardiales bacterium]
MTYPPTHPPAEAVADPTLLDLLTLEPLERDLFRATTVFEEQWALYGGQVAAQALLAAGRTVDEDRSPHSLHGYYLRGGDASRPTLFRVYRDRDGRSFSARRVVAIQNGEVIFNMSASFHVAEEGLDRQFDPPIDAGDPREQQAFTPPRLFSMEGRLPKQPFPGVQWPTRFWARCTQDLPPDPLTQACVLTYLSDILTGLAPLHDGTWRTGSSLDHAVWFHRPIRLDDWALVDLVPHTVSAGRGWYTGTVRDRGGRIGASLTQETLFRKER